MWTGHRKEIPKFTFLALVNTPHRRSTTVSVETYPVIHLKFRDTICNFALSY